MTPFSMGGAARLLVAGSPHRQVGRISAARSAAPSEQRRVSVAQEWLRALGAPQGELRLAVSGERIAARKGWSLFQADRPVRRVSSAAA